MTVEATTAPHSGVGAGRLLGPLGTAGLARPAAGRRARSLAWAAASVCIGATLAAGASPRAAAAAITSIPGSLSAVSARSASSAWAVGQTSTTKTLILRWNGTRWAQVPSPSPGAFGTGLDGVSVVSASNAWAVGFSDTRSGGKALALHWNGVRWSQAASTVPGISGLSGVSALSARDVWAVGSDSTATGVSKTLVLHWNGTKWALVPSPSPGPMGAVLNAVSAVSARDVWAVGRSLTRTGRGKTLVLHWNGTKWAAVPSPSPGVHDDSLNGVSAVSASDVWAVGFNDNSIAADFTLVLHWNGTSWTRVPSPSPGGGGNSQLGGVSALTGSNAWASGSYATAAGGEKTLLLHWNGTSWTRVPSPSPGGGGTNDSFLAGVSTVSATDAWAAGGTFVSTGPQRTLLLHWNGASWTQS